MLLYEFAEPDPILVKLTALTSQLKSDIENGETDQAWTVDDLLTYYKDNGIVLDKSDLYNMIKNPPLNKTIANIQGDNVVFKGSEQAPADDEKDQEVVAQMAQDAATNVASSKP